MRIVKNDNTILYSKPFLSKLVAYYGSVSAEESRKIQNSSACFEVNYANIVDGFEVTEIVKENIEIDSPNNIVMSNDTIENNISNELNEPTSNTMTNSESNSSNIKDTVNYGIIIGGFAFVGFISIILCIIFIRNY